MTFRNILIVLLTGLSLSFYGGNIDSLYYICDGGNELWRVNRVDGNTTQIGDLGVSNVEAMAYWPGTETIYACNNGDFGTVNKNTGVYSSIGEVDGGGTANGSDGPQSLDDVDGLSFDPWTGKLWASNRRGSYDILFQINPTTGLFVTDAFGPGIDYLIIDGTGVFTDIDDIAISPVTGRMFTVSTQGGSAQLVEINKSTGSVVVSSSSDRGDVEGLSYHNDGTFWGTIGTDIDFVQIDPATGVTSNSIDIQDAECTDPEAISALVADINLVQGKVWDDLDFNSAINGAEIGISGVTVNLYYDQNNNGIYDGGDFIIQSEVTDGSGDYEFEFATTANLLVSIDQTTLPSGYAMTTSNLEDANFNSFGQIDINNNFGAASGPDSDGDGIPDFYEGTTVDTDLDGVLDYLDLDSDNDGILDADESIADQDNDGVPNYIDLDSDNDGIPDAIEANGGLYPANYDNTRGKSVGLDSDNDGLLDAFDNAPNSAYGVGSTSNQPVPNSDGDSVADYLDLDADGDGLMDVVEAGGIDSDGNGIIDGFADANGDGYFDGSNVTYLLITNSDADGLADYIDIDSDGDGIIDTREGFPTNSYPNPVVNLDDDGDGIFNIFDTDQGGSPANYEDTDGDGIPDYKDLDSDGDGVTDIIEGNDADFNGVADSSPSGTDSDNDGLDDTFDNTPGVWGGTSNVPEQNQDADSQPDWRDLDDLNNPGIFYYVCDASNELYSINPFTGVNSLVGGNGVGDIEGIAYWDGTLYAANGGDFGTLSLVDGSYSSIGEIDGGGVANGAEGGQTLNDVDGLSFDPWTGILWGSNRRNGAGIDDLLFHIDPTTGQYVPDAFGAGIDYLVIGGAGVFDDVDDIAVNPADGKLYTVGNNGGNDQLLNINKYTGAISIVDILSETDIEGMAYFNDATFYGTIGTNPGSFWNIDPADGNMTGEVALPCGDPEALAALVAPVNNVTGTVWEDLDNDQTINGAEAGFAGVTVNLYYDVNGDGLFDPSDILLQSQVTDANGDYDFEFATTANLITTIDLTTLPAGYALTTDNIETASFTDNVNFNELDTDNNFGIVSDTDCDSDGIPDFAEGGVGVDTDGDGVDNICDLDSDNDGILDAVETSGDTDGDGIPNYLDLDSDNDGIPDAIEANDGVAPAGYVGNNGYLTGADIDGDGLIDSVDSDLTGSAGSTSSLPNNDHDQDGIRDYLDLDSDNDGILDVVEAGGTDANADGIIDGFTDGNANGYGDNLTTNPLPIANSDSQGLPDYIDLDSDDDGIDDTTEGLSTADYGTPSNVSDVDGDGIIDYWDTNLGGASIDPVDTDGDGTPDFQDLDSDGDSVLDVIEGNDLDGDGVADYTSAGVDSDGDGILDEYDAECTGGGTGYFSAPAEDGEENVAGGTPDITSSDLELIREGNDQIIGVTYSSVNIPQGETINSAFMQFRTDETNNLNPLTLTITAHDVDNSSVVAATANNISSRIPTSASVTWSPADWTTAGEAGTDQQTVDLKTIIQEIVNIPTWVSGNNITILITGTSGGRRTAESNNGDGGPTLSISYGSSGSWGCATNTPHQDFNSDGEDDWRDIDDDGDGILTFDETADLDGNGTPDYLETATCPVGQIQGPLTAGNADSQTNTGTANAGNALGAPDGSYASVNSGDNIILDLTDIIPAGEIIQISIARRQTTGGVSTAEIEQSLDGVSFSNIYNYTSTVSQPTYEIVNYLVNGSGARYIRVTRTARGNALDGLTYSFVQCLDDFDMDGIPNSIDEDDDNDGISDVAEGNGDNDGDGQIDALDLDSDNDGIVDAIEANGGSLPANMNNEGQYSAAFVIANGGANGWYELSEGGETYATTGATQLDSDSDGVEDRVDLDSDNDGIVDAVEANTGVLPIGMDTNGQYPVAYATANDTDGDGIVDDVDSDNGGTILDNPDTDGDGDPNYLDDDSDGDSVSDNLEGFDPDVILVDINDDADGDGINDVFDTDNGGTFANLPDEDCNLIADYLDIIKNTVTSGSYTFGSTWFTGTVPNAGKSVVVTSGHTLNLTGNVTIGSLYIQPGATFNLNGYDLTILGYFDVSGTFNNGGGKVFLSGTCTQTVCGDIVFYDLAVNNPNGVNMSCGDISVANELELTDGIMSTCSANSFTMQSSAAGTAYISGAGTGTVICDITLERYKEGCADGWLSLGSPYVSNTLNDWDDDVVTTGFPLSDFPSFSFTSVYSYNETAPGTQDDGWEEPNSINDGITRGKGYYVYEGTANYPLTIDVTGTPNLNTFTFPVSYTSTGSPANDGWNLLANPFPSAIEWDLTDPTKWINVGCCDATYVWNECVDQFASYISQVGTNDGASVIPSSSAFWVKAHFPGASLKCTREAMVPDYGNFRSLNSNHVDAVFTMHIDGFSKEDEVKFRVLSTASHGHDDFGDALKIESDETNMGIYIKDNQMGMKNSIEAFPNDGTNKVIPVYVRVPNTGSYTLDFTGGADLPDDMCFIFEDLLTGTFLDLKTATYYTCNIDAVANFENRFVVNVSYPIQPVVTDLSCKNAQDGSIVFEANGVGPYDVIWTDALGSIVRQVNTSGNDTLQGLSAGEYTINVIDNGSNQCNNGSKTVTVSEPANGLNLSGISHNQNCDGSNGYINLSVGGGEAPYSYLWSNGVTDQDINDVAPGTYEVEVMDANGCVAEQIFNVNATPQVSAAFTISSDTINSTNGETVNPMNTSSATNYVWYWGDGNVSVDAQPEYTYTQDGQYEITLIASTGGCTDTLTRVVTVVNSLDLNPLQVNDGILTRFVDGKIWIDFESLPLGDVNISIYDAQGKLVILDNGNSGNTRIVIPANQLSNGNYIVLIEADSFESKQRVNVIK